MTLRCPLAGGVDEGAALSASLAGYGPERQIPVIDADEIDKPSASLTGNGIKVQRAF